MPIRERKRRQAIGIEGLSSGAFVRNIAVRCARLTLAASIAAIASTAQANDDAATRADLAVAQMTPAEKVILTHGIMALPLGPTPPEIPADAVLGAGYVPGIPRLSVPALRETDASLGVAYVFGLRRDGATALPSGLAMASTWNDDLVERGGRMIGGEARAKGFNVLLAGGVNLQRDPRNGRNFEYFGEDPLLSGRLAGHAIRGIQSNHIISTIKHFALNAQETGRHYVDSRIAEKAARESDLLAFKIGIEIGNPGAVMCAYNLVNGAPACSNDWLLNKVLKVDWGYQGFVMSDWGAVPGIDAALNGLDQQSGEQLDQAVFFGKLLADAAIADSRYRKRLDDMNRRILWSIYDNQLDRFPATPGAAIDFTANAAVAQSVAEQGIVLLRNRNDALPLAAAAKRILVVGGRSNLGVLSGAGSSQVQDAAGPAAMVAIGDDDATFASFAAESFQRSSPLAAIKALAPAAEVRFRTGRYLSEVVTQAKQADVVIVFANQWSSEGYDQPDLSLPEGQDALITAITDANPQTIVVLQTGGPVLMPWLEKTAAVLEAWYPGTRGGEAIASVLFGKSNPSGRLPVTFPASTAQLPRESVDGFDKVEPSFVGARPQNAPDISANLDIEGSDIGYRWASRKNFKPLFPFGFGLSYSRFATSDLRSDGKTARFTVSNIGARAGATVAQLYLVSRNGQKMKRLVGYQRVDLQPGEARQVSLTIDPRLLADWMDGGWMLAGGRYQIALGENADDLSQPVSIKIAERKWKDATSN